MTDSMSSVKGEWKQELLFKHSAHKITAAGNIFACDVQLTPSPQLDWLLHDVNICIASFTLYCKHFY